MKGGKERELLSQVICVTLASVRRDRPRLDEGLRSRVPHSPGETPPPLPPPSAPP